MLQFQIKNYSDFLLDMQKRFVDKGDKMYTMWIFFFKPIIVVTHPDTVKALLRAGELKPKGKMDGFHFLKPWLGRLTY